MRLSDGHERDFHRITTGAAGRGCDAVLHACNVFGNGHKAVTTKVQIPVLHAGEAPARHIPAPDILCHMMAVGGAGSLGSPAAVSGKPLTRIARRNITI